MCWKLHGFCELMLKMIVEYCVLEMTGLFWIDITIMLKMFRDVVILIQFEYVLVMTRQINGNRIFTVCRVSILWHPHNSSVQSVCLFIIFLFIIFDNRDMPPGLNQTSEYLAHVCSVYCTLDRKTHVKLRHKFISSSMLGKLRWTRSKHATSTCDQLHWK